jgi:hypothetical protein
MLYQLSYASPKEMERETGIEPATNGLEGRDSTIELLPPAIIDFTGSGRAGATGQAATESAESV